MNKLDEHPVQKTPLDEEAIKRLHTQLNELLDQAYVDGNLGWLLLLIAQEMLDASEFNKDLDPLEHHVDERYLSYVGAVLRLGGAHV